MFNSGKIWRIQNVAQIYTDEELVTLIKQGKIKGDMRITNRDLKKWIKVKDTIYQFYLKDEKQDEKEV